MPPFRGSDETLDKEIETGERMARVRLRRASSELRDLHLELRELRRERAKRRAARGATALEQVTASVAAEGATRD
ncbi:MAG: hypothetical protein L3K07_04620 [Thermoplasmata archaeon]|nr:hypothetical protein [Thermoplasmata archaeon]